VGKRHYLAKNSTKAEARTSVTHGEKLLWVLTVALSTKAFGHGQPQLEAGVVVRLDFTVAPFAARRRVSSVLFDE
jgi:hypothetical protein